METLEQGPYARLLYFFGSLLSVSGFSLTKSVPRSFVSSNRSVAGKAWDGSGQGGGTRRKNGTSAQMTARSIKKRRKPQPAGVFYGGDTTQARRNNRHGVRTWTTNVEKVCVLLQDGRCRCENTCWQVGFSGKMHSYSFFTPFGSSAYTSSDVCSFRVFRSERSCISQFIIKWLKNIQQLEFRCKHI